MALLATVLACLSIQPACGGPALEKLPAVASFALVYERSGGLKPVPRRLKIGTNRNGAVEEIRPGIGEGRAGRAGSTFKVSAKAIRGLRRALGRARFASLPSPGSSPGTCADCYSYEIRYRHHVVKFNDTTMPDALRPVVQRLEALIEAHLPFH
jgi:hypothetical protein